MGPRAASPSLKPPVVSWSLMVSNCLCVRAAPHRRRRRCAFYPKRERATGQARARCWCGREYRVEQSLLVSSLSVSRRRRAHECRAVRVCLPRSRRGGLGLARRVRARTSAGGAEKQRTDQRGRRGPGLGGSCGGAGAGQVGGSGVATSRLARVRVVWGRGGTAGGFAVSVPVTSPLGGPVPRPGGRASARPSGYASRYGAGVHAAGLFVSGCRFDGSVGRLIRIGPPAAGRRESLRAALRPSRISVHGSYSAGDVGRVRPPPRRLVPAPVRTAAPRFLTISRPRYSPHTLPPAGRSTLDMLTPVQNTTPCCRPAPAQASTAQRAAAPCSAGRRGTRRADDHATLAHTRTHIVAHVGHIQTSGSP